MKTRKFYRYSFTNQFESGGLKTRILMMNQARSDEAWWRYALLWVTTVLVMMACQNWQKTDELEVAGRRGFPLSNPTRVLVDKIETGGAWGRLLTYHQRKSKNKSESVLEYAEPFIIGLKDNLLTLADSYKSQTRVYINGKEASAALLAQLPVNLIEEFFVLHQFEGMDTYDEKPYCVLIQISDQPIAMLPGRQQLIDMLQAAAISDHPLGVAHTYSMNKVLEATFFGYKDVFVKRTKNQHLKLQDEFLKDITVYINGISVDTKEVETVHVREVDKLYTSERPYTKWMRTGKRESRYVLFIKTAPKRARRDSSYYVFSPFYSGDF